MALDGISSGSGTQFDFTDLTRSQAIAAGTRLFQEGKLTAQQEGYLQSFSVDVASINGGPVAPEFQLNSSVTRNYLDLIRQDIEENRSLGAGQLKEVAIGESLLRVLSQDASTGSAFTSEESNAFSASA